MAEQRISYDFAEASSAKVYGFGDIRNFMDADLTEFARSEEWIPRPRKKMSSLVISGGGAGGAFGVGILKAWTENGDRPQFDIVTGVSTGALIAPFAFLGSPSDDLLVRLFTSGMATDLVRPNPKFGASLWKQAPLREMVELQITDETVQLIAAEHRKGRRLMVLTTNLDAQRAVIWNLGAIANSGRPEALQLLRDVLIASASIPGFYPPVLIKVTSGTMQFEEMHSDGGSASQVLTFPDDVITAGGNYQPLQVSESDIFVIVNNAMMPEFHNVPNGTLSVIGRAYTALVKSQTKSALLAAYGYAQKVGMRFHVASIDTQLPFSMRDPFNTEYMRSAYFLGYEAMRANRLWKDKPVFPYYRPGLQANGKQK